MVLKKICVIIMYYINKAFSFLHFLYFSKINIHHGFRITLSYDYFIINTYIIILYRYISLFSIMIEIIKNLKNRNKLKNNNF